MFPHHKKIFSHVFTIDKETGKFPYRTIIYSCPKKSGKTAWGAAIGAWYAAESYPGTEIYVLANDREQAEGRMMKAMKYDAEHNQELDYRKIHNYNIDYPNGTTVQVLSSHYTSAAGGQQALTLWDELWGYQTERTLRLWEEMTLIPTEKLGLRVVVTYAGFEGESHLLWDLYEKTVLNGIRLKDEFPLLPCYTNQEGTMFVYWDHEPRMPWQTAEYYEAEQVELRPVNFRRLHLNEWGSAEDVFIEIELWDKATTLEAPLLYMPDSPYIRYPISIGVDVGVKRDTSAVVGVYSYTDPDGSINIGLAFHKIWKPSASHAVDPKDIEEYIREMYGKFKINSITADPTHFYQNIMALEREGFPVREYPQTVANMVKASTALYESLRFMRLRVYPDKELRDHIQFAAAKVHGSGWRIVKKEDGAKPNDAAIALALAVHDAVERGGQDFTQSQNIPSRFSDSTAWPTKDKEEDPAVYLPPALRDVSDEEIIQQLEDLKSG